MAMYGVTPYINNTVNTLLSWPPPAVAYKPEPHNRHESLQLIAQQPQRLIALTATNRSQSAQYSPTQDTNNIRTWKINRKKVKNNILVVGRPNTTKNMVHYKHGVRERRKLLNNYFVSIVSKIYPHAGDYTNKTIKGDAEYVQGRQLASFVGNVLNTVPLPAPVFLVGLIFLAFLAQFYWFAVLNTIAQTSSSSISSPSSSSSSSSGTSSLVQSSVALPSSFIVQKDDLIAALQQSALPRPLYSQVNTNSSLAEIGNGSIGHTGSNGSGTSDGNSISGGQNETIINTTDGTNVSSSNGGSGSTNGHGEIQTSGFGSTITQNIFSTTKTDNNNGSSEASQFPIDPTGSSNLLSTTDVGRYTSTNPQGLTMPLVQVVTPAPPPSYMMKMPAGSQGLIPW